LLIQSLHEQINQKLQEIEKLVRIHNPLQSKNSCLRFLTAFVPMFPTELTQKHIRELSTFLFGKQYENVIVDSLEINLEEKKKENDNDNDKTKNKDKEKINGEDKNKDENMDKDNHIAKEESKNVTNLQSMGDEEHNDLAVTTSQEEDESFSFDGNVDVVDENQKDNPQEQRTEKKTNESIPQEMENVENEWEIVDVVQ